MDLQRVNVSITSVRMVSFPFTLSECTSLSSGYMKRIIERMCTGLSDWLGAVTLRKIALQNQSIDRS